MFYTVSTFFTIDEGYSDCPFIMSGRAAETSDFTSTSGAKSFIFSDNGKTSGNGMYPLVMTNSLPWKITMLLIGKPSINGPSIPWLCWITRGYHINSYYTWTMGVELLILFLRSRRWNKMNLHDLCARKWMKMLISAQPSRWKTGPACSGSSPGFGLRIRPSNHDSNASWCPFLAATESNTANTLWCIGKYRKI